MRDFSLPVAIRASARGSLPRARKGVREGILDAAWLKIKLTIFRDRPVRGRGGEAVRRRHGKGAEVETPLRDGAPVQCSEHEGSVEVPHPSPVSIII